MQENHKRLKENYKSYFLIAGLGLVMGAITRLIDVFPYHSLWSFSSMAVDYGFWMITSTIIIYFSSSNKNAAINVFLYLFTMNFSFYYLEYVLQHYTKFYQNLLNDPDLVISSRFNWNLLIWFDALALLCGAISYVLYFWNKSNKTSNALYAFPICGLVTETVFMIERLYSNHINLFPVILNSVGIGALGCLFYKKANNKIIYMATVIIGSLLGTISCILYYSV